MASLNARARRNMFEKTVTIDEVKRYIEAHHFGMTQTVKDCFHVSNDFQKQANTLEIYLKPDKPDDSFTSRGALDTLLNHITVNMRNANFWRWIALYIARIEGRFGVSMFENRDDIVVGNYPQELQDLTGYMYKIHDTIRDGRSMPPQSDSKYSLMGV